MEEELTQEEIAWAISAAYDSLKIVNDIKSKEEKTEEDKDSLSRNEQHIRIMMAKDWFVDALTEEQRKELKEI